MLLELCSGGCVRTLLDRRTEARGLAASSACNLYLASLDSVCSSPIPSLTPSLLSIPEVLHLVRSVASALVYLHRHRVVHRDLSPQNVLIGDAPAVISCHLQHSCVASTVRRPSVEVILGAESTALKSNRVRVRAPRQLIGVEPAISSTEPIPGNICSANNCEDTHNDIVPDLIRRAIKLTDFNCSLRLPTTHIIHRPIDILESCSTTDVYPLGALRYMAPEIFLSEYNHTGATEPPSLLNLVFVYIMIKSKFHQ